MAKQKKKSVQLATSGFGVKTIAPKQLDAKLRRAADFAEAENWQGALGILVPLSQQYPDDKRIWGFLSDASFESGDRQLYQKACERLFAITADSDYAYALGSAYFRNMHPLMALSSWRQALTLDPNHESAAQVRKAIKRLEPMEKEVLAQLNLTGPEGVAIAILHEQGQAYLEQGDYQEARQAESKILENYPGFIPARNNLSLVSWMEKDVEGAIATATSVLEIEPDNIHALSNLINFLVLSGDAEAARVYGDRLKSSHADAWDGWTKKVEGLTYLADDAGVVEIWHQAQAAKVEDTPSAQFYHLSAVALARTGDEKKAIAQWKKALSRNPGWAIAQANLADIRKPMGQRHGAWPFAWRQWFMPASADDFNALLEANLKVKKMDKMSDNFEAFLKAHADVVAMLPRILERGGPNGQDFFLSTAQQLQTPALLSVIKDFALSQNGTDDMRFQAAKLANEAQLMPKESVSLWLDGEWREIALQAYTFHNEPTRRHSKAIERLAKPAFSLIQQGGKAQAIEAETLLRQALKLTTEAPDLMNNLAMALSQQGREDEADELIQEIVASYPDYIFASVGLARQHLVEGELEAAEEILKPFLSRDRFHIMEFGAFSDTYISLLMLQNKKDVARSWFEMWEKVYPEDTKLAYWRPRLKKGFKLPKLFR
jgi:tetratricopeptide (TPR) repeat protein